MKINYNAHLRTESLPFKSKFCNTVPLQNLCHFNLLFCLIFFFKCLSDIWNLIQRNLSILPSGGLKIQNFHFGNSHFRVGKLQHPKVKWVHPRHSGTELGIGGRVFNSQQNPVIYPWQSSGILPIALGRISYTPLLKSPNCDSSWVGFDLRELRVGFKCYP